MLKARRDDRLIDLLGIASVLSSASGKGSLDPYMELVYSPSELRKAEEERRRAEQEKVALMMATKMRAMMSKYDIKEVEVSQDGRASRVDPHKVRR